MIASVPGRKKMLKKLRRLLCSHVLKKRYDRKTRGYVYQCVICGAVFRRVRRNRYE